jgi:hypothetical protein
LHQHSKIPGPYEVEETEDPASNTQSLTEVMTVPRVEEGASSIYMVFPHTLTLVEETEVEGNIAVVGLYE